MERYRDQHSVEEMCRALQVKRSGYYAWRKSPVTGRMRDEALLINRIKNAHKVARETYGSPRIKEALNKATPGAKVGKHRVARLMRENGVKAKTRRKFKRTTDSKHQRPISPNLLKDAQEPAQANEIWVGDITYVATDEGWLYLATVLDLYSRKIVGWSMSSRLVAELALDALQQAIMRRGAVPLIFHSDRGTQYASREYQQELQRYRIFGSMSGAGNCYDNACAESFFHTLKTEHIYFEHYTTRQEAIASIFEYIEVFYNRQRLHSYLGYMSPVNFETGLEKVA
jgi:putative transposase